MGLVYDPPPTGSLRQGEILSGIYEHRPKTPPTYSEGMSVAGVEFETNRRPLAMLLNPWCDLLHDYELRQGTARTVSTRNFLDHAILCELFEEANIQVTFDNKGLFKRAEENRDERYYRIPQAEVGSGDALPVLYMDFKKFFTIPPAGLYEAMRSGHVKRIALMPDVYREHLVQRFFFFMSRVSLPD